MAQLIYLFGLFTSGQVARDMTDSTKVLFGYLDEQTYAHYKSWRQTFK